MPYKMIYYCVVFLLITEFSFSQQRICSYGMHPTTSGEICELSADGNYLACEIKSTYEMNLTTAIYATEDFQLKKVIDLKGYGYTYRINKYYFSPDSKKLYINYSLSSYYNFTESYMTYCYDIDKDAITDTLNSDMCDRSSCLTNINDTLCFITVNNSNGLEDSDTSKAYINIWNSVTKKITSSINTELDFVDKYSFKCYYNNGSIYLFSRWGNLIVYNLATQQIATQKQLFEMPDYRSGYYFDFIVSADFKYMYCCLVPSVFFSSADSTELYPLFIYDLSNFNIIKQYDSISINGVSQNFSLENKLMIHVYNYDHYEYRLISAEDGSVEKTFINSSNPYYVYNRFVFLNDNKYIYTFYGIYKRAFLFDYSTESTNISEESNIVSFDYYMVENMYFLDDSTLLFKSVDQYPPSNYIKIYKFYFGKYPSTIARQTDVDLIKAPNNDSKYEMTSPVSWNSDKKLLCVPTVSSVDAEYNQINIYNFNSNSVATQTIPLDFTSTINCVDISPSGNLLIIGCADNTMYVYNLGNLSLSKTIQTDSSVVFCYFIDDNNILYGTQNITTETDYSDAYGYIDFYKYDISNSNVTNTGISNYFTYYASSSKWGIKNQIKISKDRKFIYIMNDSGDVVRNTDSLTIAYYVNNQHYYYEAHYDAEFYDNDTTMIVGSTKYSSYICRKNGSSTTDTPINYDSSMIRIDPMNCMSAYVLEMIRCCAVNADGSKIASIASPYVWLQVFDMSDNSTDVMQESAQVDNSIIYPNPVTNWICCVLESMPVGAIDISAVDIIGNQYSLNDYSMDNNKLIIKNISLSNGVYFIKIKYNDKVYHQRFIVYK